MCTATPVLEHTGFFGAVGRDPVRSYSEILTRMSIGLGDEALCHHFASVVDRQAAGRPRGPSRCHACRMSVAVTQVAATPRAAVGARRGRRHESRPVRNEEQGPSARASGSTARSPRALRVEEADPLSAPRPIGRPLRLGWRSAPLPTAPVVPGPGLQAGSGPAVPAPPLPVMLKNVPPAGLEPAPPAPEAGALSAQLGGVWRAWGPDVSTRHARAPGGQL